MVLNIRGLSRGVVCDKGEVELLDEAKYTLYEFRDRKTFNIQCTLCMLAHA